MINELICIRCPLGCNLKVETDDSTGEVLSVTGNSCPLGLEYGKNEVTKPMRTVTSTVELVGGELEVLPVKTEHDIPKAKIWETMEAIRKASVEAPVQVGDVVVENVADTGVNVVATRAVDSE